MDDLTVGVDGAQEIERARRDYETALLGYKPVHSAAPLNYDRLRTAILKHDPVVDGLVEKAQENVTIWSRVNRLGSLPRPIAELSAALAAYREATDGG